MTSPDPIKEPMRFYIEHRYVMCERCKALDARRRVMVDPGVGYPVTVLGNFCITCAANTLNDYQAGRRTFLKHLTEEGAR